jgi:hypothetical protein
MRKIDKKAAQAEVEADNSDGIKEFFSEIGAVKETVALVKNSIAAIKALHDRALNNVISEKENARN